MNYFNSRGVLILLVGLVLSSTCSSSSPEPNSKAKTTTLPGMANNGNSERGGPNMRWGREAAPDGSWEYSWGTGSVPGGPTFSYGSGSATSEGSTGTGFGFSWTTEAAGSGSGSGQGQNHHGFGQSHYGFGQPHMHMPHYGMPFGPFHMGPTFQPPRPPPHDNHRRGGRNGGAASSR